MILCFDTATLDLQLLSVALHACFQGQCTLTCGQLTILTGVQLSLPSASQPLAQPNAILLTHDKAAAK